MKDFNLTLSLALTPGPGFRVLATGCASERESAGLKTDFTSCGGQL